MSLAFARVVPIEEIRAKEGNLSIPLYVGSETSTVREDSAEYQANALPEALSAWPESNRRVRSVIHRVGSDCVY